MGTIQKDKMMGFVGLGLAIVGILSILLAMMGALEGAMYLMGYFLGAGLVLSGLIMAGVYFWRWGRIQRLFRGEDLLADWSGDGGNVLISHKNAFIDGKLYEWAIPGTRLDDICVKQESNFGITSNYLEISLSESRRNRQSVLPDSTFWKSSGVRTRIPAGEESKAAWIVEEIKKYKK
jgi:hypothetical protein